MSKPANFIDAGYFFKTQAYFNAPRIDFARLAKAMAHGREAVSTYYYDCPPASDCLAGNECGIRTYKYEHFIRTISRIPGFKPRLGRLSRQTCCECGKVVYRQKRVDTQLAVDLVVLAVTGVVTDVSLFAGDSDFIPVVNAAQAYGCRVHLFYGSNAHAELIAACDSSTVVSLGYFQGLARPAFAKAS